MPMSSKSPKIDDFIAWKRNKDHIKPSTVVAYGAELERFQGFLELQDERRLIWLADRNDVSRFLSEFGMGNLPRSTITRSAPIKQYFSYLYEEGIRKDNPCAGLRLKKAPRRTATLFALARNDIKKLLASPEKHPREHNRAGYLSTRDKAILHVFYSGLKKAEALSLLARDVEIEKQRVRVSDRHVALTKAATDALRVYLEVRPASANQALFPGRSRDSRKTNIPLSGHQIWKIVKDYVDLCGLDQRTTLETLRATYAVHAIEDRVGFVELIDTLGNFDDVWLRKLVDIARPQMEAALAAESVELSASRVYAAGSDYSFYRDVGNSIAKAQATVFIIDAYLSVEFFDLYVSKVPDGVTTRILSKGSRKSNGTALDPNVELLAKKLARSKSLELRISQALHDRHVFIDGRGWAVGQSIKDAAQKSATYVIELTEPTLGAMRSIHERTWKGAKIII